MNRIFSVVLLTVLFLGCGTDTGNPGLRRPIYNGGTGGLFANAVVSTTCKKLVECHSGLTEKDCQSGVFNLNNLDDEFGLAPGAYGTFAQVTVAEAKGELTADWVAGEACLDDLSALTCDDPRVRGAYRPGETQKFAQVYKMFDPGCSAVY